MATHAVVLRNAKDVENFWREVNDDNPFWEIPIESFAEIAKDSGWLSNFYCESLRDDFPDFSDGIEIEAGIRRHKAKLLMEKLDWHEGDDLVFEIGGRPQYRAKVKSLVPIVRSGKLEQGAIRSGLKVFWDSGTKVMR